MRLNKPDRAYTNNPGEYSNAELFPQKHTFKKKNTKPAYR
jgi:hypothetical protein